MDRVFLRAPEAGDGEGLTRLARVSRERDQPWASPARTPRQFAAYLSRSHRPDFDAQVICLRATGEAIGMINVSQIFHGAFRSAYLGYWIAQPYEGQGLMREALRLALRRVFVTLRLHRVEANIQPDNRRSIALVKALGFRREGYSPRYLKIDGAWRDHERFAITLEDWRARGARPPGTTRKSPPHRGARRAGTRRPART